MYELVDLCIPGSVKVQRSVFQHSEGSFCPAFCNEMLFPFLYCFKVLRNSLFSVGGRGVVDSLLASGSRVSLTVF